jgi:N-dimethylarginine dimethylaminohydrolase
MRRPHFLMTDPSGFDVRYQINPWMRPEAWGADRAVRLAEARNASAALRRALEAEGAIVEMLPAAPGQPDLVFPANAAVVLDGTVMPARFRHPERQGEEAHFRRAFEAPELRIEATAEDAAAFCVNAVNLGRTIIMARPPASLRRRLEARGYRVVAVDLDPFMLSGGAAYCMTLRLDRMSRPATIKTPELEGAL